MKFLISFSTLALLMVSVSYAQTNTFPASGNVGIGTLNPSAELEINSGSGITAFKATGTHGYLLIDNVGSGQAYYQADTFHQFQGATGTPILTMLGAGNVGVGTTSPITKLDVSGLLHVQSGVLNYPSAGGSYIGWNKSGGGGEANFVNNIAGGSIGGFTFDRTADGASFTRLLTILDNGNVGIGKTIPAAKLDIVNSGAGITALKAAGVHGSVSIDNVGSGELYYQADALHQFQGTSGTPILTMLSAGNVGVGTATPITKLDVSGILHVRYPGVLNYSSTGGTYIGWNKSGGGGEANFVNNIEGGNVGGFAFDKTSDGSTFTRLFTILDNGNVGIGITDTKGYMLAVNGSAIATSVTVKLYSNWPDYVFKPNYNLPTLKEVKTYVDKNHHLPEMPSAQEIAANGLNLGEVVKLQTKKIEELTLYLIEQQKQIEKMKKDQENRIAVMEKMLLKFTESKQ